MKTAPYLKYFCRIVGVYDPDESVLNHWSSCYPGVNLIKDKGELRALANDSYSAVFVASPPEYHISQSVEFLKKGKHVLCEVPLGKSGQKTGDLEESLKTSQGRFMLAENFFFRSDIQLLQKLIKENFFGHIYNISVGYYHNCMYLFYGKSKITWRGKMRLNSEGMGYPTHFLAVVEALKGNILKNIRDFKYLKCFSSSNNTLISFFRERGLRDKELDEIKTGDQITCIFSLPDKTIVQLNYNIVSNQRKQRLDLRIQGTHGHYTSGRWEGEAGVAVNQHGKKVIIYPLEDSVDLHHKRNSEIGMINHFYESIINEKPFYFNFNTWKLWMDFVDLSRSNNI